MQIHFTISGPDEIRAIEYRARQMRAETVATGFRALARALSGLAGRITAAFARTARS